MTSGNESENRTFRRFVRLCTCMVSIISTLIGLCVVREAFRNQSLWKMMFGLFWILISGYLFFGWLKRKRSFYKPFIFANAALNLLSFFSSIHLVFKYFRYCDTIEQLHLYESNVNCNSLQASVFFFTLSLIQCFSLYVVTADFGFINVQKEQEKEEDNESMGNLV